MNKKVIITGSNGYLGSSIAGLFERTGQWDVASLTGTTGQAWRLGNSLPESIEGSAALVHCAYDFRALRWKDIYQANVLGSRALLRDATQAGVQRMVLISTISAFDDCKSLYGRAKLEIETEFRAAGALILRPGLIYGEGYGGMVGKIAALIEKAPLLPLFSGGGQIQYLSHHDDIGAACLAFCAGELPAAAGRTVTAANPTPWRFREVIEEIARKKNRPVHFFSLPWRAVWGGLKMAEALGLALPLRSDSLLSLMNQNPAPDFQEDALPGIKFRPLERTVKS